MPHNNESNELITSINRILGRLIFYLVTRKDPIFDCERFKDDITWPELRELVADTSHLACEKKAALKKMMAYFATYDALEENLQRMLDNPSAPEFIKTVQIIEKFNIKLKDKHFIEHNSSVFNELLSFILPKQAKKTLGVFFTVLPKRKTVRFLDDVKFKNEQILKRIEDLVDESFNYQQLHLQALERSLNPAFAETAHQYKEKATTYLSLMVNANKAIKLLEKEYDPTINAVIEPTPTTLYTLKT